jgi:hypothetical protein
MVYSENRGGLYGHERWQEHAEDHGTGMYHALIEARIPFEMVNDRLLDAEHLKPFKLVILPNIASLSDAQCHQLRHFVDGGGSLLATFESSLYDEQGRRREDFGLADLFGVSFGGQVEGPMNNSYLRLKRDSDADAFHPVLDGLEEAYRIINGIWRLKVTPRVSFPAPVTLIPTYPDLPMEHVYPREPETSIREVYLRQRQRSRVAYIPWDIDRTFWEIMNVDHGKLLGNIVRWALDEPDPATVTGPGLLDVTVWRQQQSMTVHLVNLTNPMMMKGPFRELIPIGPQNIRIRLPEKTTAKRVQLLVSGLRPQYDVTDQILSVTVPSVLDHEVVAVDLT